MSKSEMARCIADLLAPNNPAEHRRLYRWHMRRPIADVRRSLGNVRAIDAVTDAEIRACQQFDGLPVLGR